LIKAIVPRRAEEAGVSLDLKSTESWIVAASPAAAAPSSRLAARGWAEVRVGEPRGHRPPSSSWLAGHLRLSFSSPTLLSRAVITQIPHRHRSVPRSRCRSFWVQPVKLVKGRFLCVCFQTALGTPASQPQLGVW